MIFLGRTHVIRKHLIGLLLAGALAWGTCAQAAVNIDRTRIIMSGNQKSVSVVLTNESHDTPYLAQVWVEDADGKTINDLLALPPLQRIDGGKKAQVRIIMRANDAFAAQLPQDRESLFYFNVREIPPEPPKTDANILQLTTQSRLKLLLRPAALGKSDEVNPERSLQILARGDRLMLKNPTPYYVTVIWLGRDNKQQLRGFDGASMLAPFSEQEVKAALPADAGEMVLGNVDDYGGLRMNRYRCATGQCVFQERLRQ
ncbi:Chaperone protein papD precursor [Achromobacter ruhlandii]|nr:Chaperone protein papD precursor [Achromobacter ruhlandii]CUJ10481.1 Chaperone protein papD precursor [Achromobacter ruhlandii]CUJ89150.1 Chaperone protein papD precursor [Achromobacter ruhlandii]